MGTNLKTDIISAAEFTNDCVCWQIYEDSIVLQSVFTSARERLEKDTSMMATEDSNDAEKSNAAESDENGAESAGDNEDSKYGGGQFNELGRFLQAATFQTENLSVIAMMSVLRIVMDRNPVFVISRLCNVLLVYTSLLVGCIFYILFTYNSHAVTNCMYNNQFTAR